MHSESVWDTSKMYWVNVLLQRVISVGVGYGSGDGAVTDELSEGTSDLLGPQGALVVALCLVRGRSARIAALTLDPRVICSEICASDGRDCPEDSPQHDVLLEVVMMTS